MNYVNDSKEKKVTDKNSINYFLCTFTNQSYYIGQKFN